ncbi:hypothetical protein [Streptomyces sp. YIM S03343]
MTAPHERHDSHGRHGGGLPVDPLMAVVTGEPLSDAQLADPAFMARHREAAADVAALREQLGLIADVLTGPAPAEEPAQQQPQQRQSSQQPQPPRLRYVAPRRRRSFAFGVLVVTAVATVLSGMAWLLAQAGGGSDSSTASADSAAGAKEQHGGAGYGSASSYLACARLVVEGDVTAVRPEKGASGRYKVTLHVTRAYKPAEVPDQVTVVTDASAAPRPAIGLHVLVGVTGRSATAAPDLWVTGEQRIAEQRAAFQRESSRTPTPTPAPGCS